MRSTLLSFCIFYCLSVSSNAHAIEWYLKTGLQVGGDKLASLVTRHCNVDFCYPSYADINAGAGVLIAIGGNYYFKDLPLVVKAHYGQIHNILVGDERSYRVGLERNRFDVALEYFFTDRLSLTAGHSWYHKLRLDLNDAGGDIVDFSNTTGLYLELNFVVERHNNHKWSIGLEKGFAEYQQSAVDGVALDNGPKFSADYTALVFYLEW